MAVGSSVNYFWMLRNPTGYDMYMFAISAGMLAGEGLGGVFQALLAIIGVAGGSKSLRCYTLLTHLIFLLRIRHRDWLPGNGILWLRVHCFGCSFMDLYKYYIPTKIPSLFITHNVRNEFDETESSEFRERSWILEGETCDPGLGGHKVRTQKLLGTSCPPCLAR
jgi:hypothetical protein